MGCTDTAMLAGGGLGVAQRSGVFVGFGARTWRFSAGGTLASPTYRLRVPISALYSVVFSRAFTFSSQ